MELLIKKLSAKIGDTIPEPYYATTGSAAMDLHACMDEPVTLEPLGRALIPTGLAIALPSAEYVALIFARSGLATKHGIALSNSVGVIDSDYRGEVKVGLVNLSNESYTIAPGDRIAQLAVMPVVKANTVFVPELPETARGEGGFGSTGKA
ncbi:MAG: dUTP diphosphatase [Ruminococcaceae bacterium]|nr:dUTP diphosphatase [Oscillospiraceae bacterium]